MLGYHWENNCLQDNGFPRNRLEHGCLRGSTIEPTFGGPLEARRSKRRRMSARKYSLFRRLLDSNLCKQNPVQRNLLPSTSTKVGIHHESKDWRRSEKRTRLTLNSARSERFFSQTLASVSFHIHLWGNRSRASNNLVQRNSNDPRDLAQLCDQFSRYRSVCN